MIFSADYLESLLSTFLSPKIKYDGYVQVSKNLMQQIRPGQGVTPSDTLMKIFQEHVRKFYTVLFTVHATNRSVRFLLSYKLHFGADLQTKELRLKFGLKGNLP